MTIGKTTFRATENTYFTVAGTLDYSTNTFTASVNGVQQFSTGVNPSFAFASVAQATNTRIEIQNMNPSFLTWNSTSIDNITLATSASAIPEPSAFAAYAGMVALLAVAAGRRRYRSV